MAKSKPPEGFKTYPMIVTPDGKIINPTSCYLVYVDVFSQRELEHAIKHSSMTLDKIMQHYGALDLEFGDDGE